MAGLFDKLKSILMIEEEIAEAKPQQTAPPVQSEFAISDARQVVNGSSPNAAMNIERSLLAAARQKKNAMLKIKVFTPNNFEQANIIANILRNKEAIIVNYEQVLENDQRRLCDFINGCCYILGGGVQRISHNIVLYVPMNVDIIKENDQSAMPAYMRNLKF